MRLTLLAELQVHRQYARHSSKTLEANQYGRALHPPSSKFRLPRYFNGLRSVL